MTLKLVGSSDGSVSLSAPSDTSPSGTDVTLTLPTSDGDANQVLQTNGSGTLSWVNQTTNTDTNTQVVQAAATSVSANGNVTVEFTGIPAGVRRICMQLDSLSPNATSNIIVQIGSSSGYVTSGYKSTGSYNGPSADGAKITNGFITCGSDNSSHAAAHTLSGMLWLSRINSGNEWVYSGLICQTEVDYTLQLGGNVDCNGTLDRVKIFNSGSNQFDNGNVNILYES